MASGVCVCRSWRGGSKSAVNIATCKLATCPLANLQNSLVDNFNNFCYFVFTKGATLLGSDIYELTRSPMLRISLTWLMVHQLKDKYLKEMIERHPEDIIGLLHLKGRYEIISTQLDKEIIIRRREADTVIKVRAGRRIYLFHLEFITRYRRQDVRYAYGLSGALTAKYNHDVVTILVVLKPPSRKAENLGQYDLAPFGRVLNRHDFAVVKLSELRDEILAGKKEYLGLVPLLPEISPKVDKKLLHRQIELIELVKDPERRAALIFYTMAFNKPYFGSKFLQTYFKEKLKMYEHWEHVPVVGDLIKQREKKSMTLVLRENILEVLTSRFGHVNGKTARLINAVDEPRTLQTIFRQALKAKSLDTIKEMLEAKKQTLRKKAA